MSLRCLPNLLALLLVPLVFGCSSNSDHPIGFGGATNGVGGAATNGGGTASPGNGGSGQGGTVATGGSAQGGNATDGSAQGGVVTNGGSPTGGNATNGGSVQGGTSSGIGGAATGGAANLGGTTASGGSTATGGKATTGGSAASTGGSTGTAGASSCPAPPADAPANAITAYNTLNAVRVAMGVPCDTLVSALDQSALAHCNYYATNKGATGGCDSTPSPHGEISGCPGFTGTTGGAREAAAGYTGRNWSECMAFLNNPTNAVMTFINSVYHRGPMLSPWMRDIGYGAATGCDTIDFGAGVTTPNTVVAFYPYAGQTGVPVNFDGSREGPTPPAPASGWPSGYPITVYVQGSTITLHELVEEATGTQLAHVFNTPATDANLSNSVVLYGNVALKAATTYRVNIQGTQTISGATTTLNLSWTFTTR